MEHHGERWVNSECQLLTKMLRDDNNNNRNKFDNKNIELDFRFATVILAGQVALSTSNCG